MRKIWKSLLLESYANGLGWLEAALVYLAVFLALPVMAVTRIVLALLLGGWPLRASWNGQVCEFRVKKYGGDLSNLQVDYIFCISNKVMHYIDSVFILSLIACAVMIFFRLRKNFLG